jgi:hypothetical protein
MAVGDFVDKAKNMAKDALDNVQGESGDAKDRAADTANDAARKAKQTGKSAGDAADNAADSAKNQEELSESHDLASMYDAANNTGDATLNSGSA